MRERMKEGKRERYRRGEKYGKQRRRQKVTLRNTEKGKITYSEGREEKRI